MDASVWLVGDFRAAEFSQAAGWLCERAVCRQFADPRDAVTHADRRELGAGSSTAEPDAIVFFATRPGVISRRQVDALSRVYPLARLVALAGQWCEGEMRSGRPWPGVVRIYWHQWQARLPEMLSELDGRLPRLPRTATGVDVLLSSHGQSRPARIASSMGIVAARKADFEALASAVGPAIDDCRWLHPGEIASPEPVELLLLDAAGDVAAAMRILEQMRSMLGSVPALVLCHFPRADETNNLLAIPQTIFLAKPFMAGDLLFSLAALVGTPAGQLASPGSVAA
jgi:hypothetical protein